MSFYQIAEFPSEDEWKDILRKYPEANKLRISHKIKLKRSNRDSIEDWLFKPDVFLSWKNRLHSKLENLRFSFIMLLHYFPELPDKNWKKHNDDGTTNFFPEYLDRHYYQHFFLGYYIESFYYHYFSSLEILAQLLNVFYDLRIKDTDVNFWKVKGHPSLGISNVLSEFHNKIKEARKNRDNLVHGFSFDEIDMRPKKEGNTISGGVYSYRDSQQSINEILFMIAEFLAIIRLVEKEMTSE